MNTNDSLPKDPAMLLSYVNTQLRDNYPSLAELCLALSADEAQIKEQLAGIDYEYDEALNRFM
ncbi:MAG: DUF4250 domain-containing protein [Lachnospiraceae bacterium]|nr:DUF4250 domain-containing protein [Lachnospiraceae bacterium]